MAAFSSRGARWLLLLLLLAGASLVAAVSAAAVGSSDAHEQRQPLLRRLQTGLFSWLWNGGDTAAAATSTSTSTSGSGAPAVPDTAATAGGGSTSGGFFSSSSLGGARDAWAEDGGLRLAQRLLDGDHLGVFKEMVASKDLDAIWSEPFAAHRLLQAHPVLRIVPGVAALADKAVEDFTPGDGQLVLARFRAFVARALELAKDGTQFTGNDNGEGTEGGIVGTMERYARRMQEDPAWAALAAEAGKEGTGDGDANAGTAAAALHDKLFDDLWGGVLDKTQLGFRSSEEAQRLGLAGKAVPVEPLATAALRKRAREAEPRLWSLLTQGDAFIEQALADPTTPMQVVGDLTAQELGRE